LSGSYRTEFRFAETFEGSLPAGSLFVQTLSTTGLD
jgi:hypothetical protein